MTTATKPPNPRRFIWPPKPLGDTDAPCATPPPPPPPAHQPKVSAIRARNRRRWQQATHYLGSNLRQALAAAEQEWLGLEATPLTARIAAAGWAADNPGDYCERCGQPIGPHESNEFGCADCRGRHLPYQKVVRLSSYATPVREWVHDMKFHRGWHLGESLGRELGRSIQLQSLTLAPPGGMVVVPVATSWRRRMARGIDQSERLACGIAKTLDVPMVRVLRKAHRPSQRAVTPSRREQNVRHAFRTRPSVNLHGKIVLLVDDVLTSGATAAAAARALARLGKDRRPEAIWICVVAVTSAPERLADAEGKAGANSAECLSSQDVATLATVLP